MSAEDRKTFLAAVVRDHGQRLRRYFSARLRYPSADVPDLVQEVYLRLLRMPKHETIRSPQAFLLTVAHHILYEHRLRQSGVPESVQMTDVLAEMESYVSEDPQAELEVRQQLEVVDRSLREISPRAYAAFVLHRQYGFSLEEIAKQFGVSRHMVKKYLAKAVLHCRERFQGVK